MKRKRILFVCVENANRSQMAEAFARMLGGDKIEAWSAGSHPAERVNPKTVKVMEEVGCDLSAHRPKSLSEIPQEEYEVVVSMGCGEECPCVPAKRREEWQIPDPKEVGEEALREIRDRIRDRVKALLEQF